MFYERLQALCKEHGVAVTTVVVDTLGMSRGNLSRWKKGGVPKGDTLSTLAEYFNVSTDYLLGTDTLKEKSMTTLDDPALVLTAEEKWFIQKLRELDKEGRTMVESTLIAEVRRVHISKGENASYEVKSDY